MTLSKTYVGLVAAGTGTVAAVTADPAAAILAVTLAPVICWGIEQVGDGLAEIRARRQTTPR